MGFHILSITEDQLRLVYILAAIVSLFVFYFIIKIAVRNGTIEAYDRMNKSYADNSASDANTTPV